MVQTMQLPRVQTCDATQCGYNHDGCHAFAITIGGAGHAPAIQVAPGHELADCVTYRTRS